MHLVGIPDGVRNFGGVLDHVLRELEIEVLPGDIPEQHRSRCHAARHRPLAVRARHQGEQRQNPERSRLPVVHRRRAAGRRGGAGRCRGSAPRPSRSSSGSRRPRTRTRPKRRLSPARHRWPGQSRPGVRRNPAQRRVSAGGPSSRRGGACGRSAAASARAEARGHWEGTTVRVLKPQTYMNRSGAALAPLRALPDFDPAAICWSWWTTSPFPRHFRLRGAGSAGGHNGLKSIEGALQRQDYARLRIGVGPAAAGCARPRRFRPGAFSEPMSAHDRRPARPDGRCRRELGDRRDRAGDEPLQPPSATPAR